MAVAPLWRSMGRTESAEQMGFRKWRMPAGLVRWAACWVRCTGMGWGGVGWGR